MQVDPITAALRRLDISQLAFHAELKQSEREVSTYFARVREERVALDELSKRNGGLKKWRRSRRPKN